MLFYKEQSFALKCIYLILLFLEKGLLVVATSKLAVKMLSHTVTMRQWHKVYVRLSSNKLPLKGVEYVSLLKRGHVFTFSTPIVSLMRK